MILQLHSGHSMTRGYGQYYQANVISRRYECGTCIMLSNEDGTMKLCAIYKMKKIQNRTSNGFTLEKKAKKGRLEPNQ
jgi:hypothetical protein